MLAGIRDVLVISTPLDLPLFRRLLGDGRDWGMTFSFAEQPHPGGLAQAFLIGGEFVRGERCCLILGDNLFYGHALPDMMRTATARTTGATVFAYHVRDPERYGVITFDDTGKARSIDEKPKVPKSNWAVTGLYFYDEAVVDFAAQLKPSARGELEITDLNRVYLERGELAVETMGRGFAWLDTGTPESLIDAAEFVRALETRQGLRISCPEEIAFRQGWITSAELEKLGARYRNCDYGRYLVQVASGAA
jgi:glucose-1-phosphate thymidylyltransferase